MRPGRLSVRIGLGVAAVAIATLLAVGAGLFVVLRGLHQDTTRAALADVSQPLVAQLRAGGVAADVRQLLADAGSSLRPGTGVYVITASGQAIGGSEDPGLDVASIGLDPSLARGDVQYGSLSGLDGRDHLYAATALRPGSSPGPKAIVLTTLDTSAGEALRDVLRTLPLVALALLVVGVPIAWLLARSVAGPLHRLADATSGVPTAEAPPLPIEGPTEVRELTARFNAMAAELRAGREREARLVADVRHDLRTPLTVIGGFGRAIEDGTVEGEAAKGAARTIVEETDRLERLVDELGTAERLQGGDGLRPEPLAAQGLLDGAVERFSAVAERAGVELTAGAAPDLTVTADRSAVERILANLVSNALASVSPGGHVLVEALPAEMPPGRRAIAFRVSDDGPGFPPGDLTRAFDRFYRGDPSRTGPGSGLGLAIVRDLARAHGGDAIAENLAPRGARVTVSLPLVPSPT